MQNNKTQVYISTIKDFKSIDQLIKHTEYYTIVTDKNNKITNNINTLYCVKNPLQRTLNEIDRMLYIYHTENYNNLPQYIGWVSYRRYLKHCLNNPEDIETILRDKKIILPQPVDLGATVYTHYTTWHNHKDIEDACNIIVNMYPQYRQDIIDVLNGKKLYANGLFLMRRDEYIRYIQWIESVWIEWRNLHKFIKDSEVEDYVREQMNEGNYINRLSTVEYQARIFGFLAERLFTIYIKHNYTTDDIYYDTTIMIE